MSPSCGVKEIKNKMASVNDLNVSQTRRSSSRSIKRKIFDDEWIGSSMTPCNPSVKKEQNTDTQLEPAENLQLQQPIQQPIPPPTQQSTQQPTQQTTPQNQPPFTGKKRGRKRKSESIDSLGAKETSKVRIEKVSSVTRMRDTCESSLSMMFLAETNSNADPVLPFSDPRTIREIHESDDVDELVNCICDFRKESGLMVQCECCLTWQHGSCLGIKAEKDLPDVYVCFICKNPRGSREKSRYKYDWNWLRNGTLPLFPGFDSSSSASNSIFLSKSNILKTNQILNDILEILQIIHDLKNKIKLLDLKNGDLSLWNTSWVTPREAKIIPVSDQEQPIVHNDFVNLKANEDDMIDDILEKVVSEDKNDEPDDLESEIVEGTDLIDFIASSYSESNGIIEEEESIAPKQPPTSENQTTELKNESSTSTKLPETFEKLISGYEVIEEDQTAVQKHNLLKHILDVRERLEKKLDLIEVKVSELEKIYGLDPNSDAVEQDACGFRNVIKNLYTDLEIVHKMSLVTTSN